MSKIHKFSQLLFKSTLITFLALSSLFVNAHPHNWISVKSEFYIDENGQLSALREYWEFDIYFSMMTIADVMHESTVQPDSLQKLATDMVNNMESYKYFSSLKVNNQSITLGKPHQYALSIVTNEQDQRQLVLSMDFQFSKPLTITNQAITWQVFDPSYYIDMRHHDNSRVIIVNKFDTQCTTHIDLPAPSSEMAEYAMSLGKMETGTPYLGRNFAEKISIKCIEPSLDIDP